MTKQAVKQETTKQETTKQVAVQMPAYMQKFMKQNTEDTNSLVASSMSVPRLSYRGKRWRYIVDGEEELIKTLTTEVIIVGVEPDAGRFIKTLYLTQYNPGDSSPPDCSSSNGVTPDIWVSSPISQRCQGCPKNIFGSAVSRSGGKAKACHDSKRLWIVRPENTEIYYGLNVPIMSLKNLSEYGKYIAKNNFPLALVVTELSMDDDSEFPKICFKHVGFVDETDSELVVDLNQRRPWRSEARPVVDTNHQIESTPTKSLEPLVRTQGTENIDDIIGEWK